MGSQFSRPGGATFGSIWLAGLLSHFSVSCRCAGSAAEYLTGLHRANLAVNSQNSLD